MPRSEFADRRTRSPLAGARAGAATPAVASVESSRLTGAGAHRLLILRYESTRQRGFAGQNQGPDRRAPRFDGQWGVPPNRRPAPCGKPGDRNLTTTLRVASALMLPLFRRSFCQLWTAQKIVALD